MEASEIGKLTLICGPPCAGKSTYLREHSSPGDVRFDWDEVYRVLTGLGPHERRAGLRSLLENFRQDIAEHWSAELRGTPENTWIISSAAKPATRARFREIGAEVVLLACDQPECHRRASDAGRPGEWHEAIDRWFGEFEPDANEEASEMKNRAVKVVDANKGILGGWGIPFGGPMEGGDLEGQFFEKDTDFALDWFPNDGRPLLYEHGMDKGIKTSVVGRQVSHKLDPDVGIWVETQLNMAHRYADAIMELAGEGALGFSSGSMKHLVVVDEATGKIVRWPWVEQSLTTVPANPYGLIAPDAVKHLEALALDVPKPILDAAAPPKKGSKFTDDAEALLADVSALIARSESIASLRAEEGKDWPGQANRPRLVQVKSQLVVMGQRLDALLTATEEPDAAKLHAEFQRIVARQQGVPVGGMNA